MKFDWRRFTETDYEKYVKNPFYDDYIGAVLIGDICIDLLIHDDNAVSYDFYVAHEDSGYGYKNDIPYDYADGGEIDISCELSYDSFKDKAEKIFMNYIMDYKGNYSLVDHANKPLEIW